MAITPAFDTVTYLNSANSERDAIGVVIMGGSSGGGGGGGGSSDTTEATQLLVRAAVDAINTDVGAPTDAAAAADGTGNYAIIPALKRSLLNWATLLARIPALVAGRLPVDGSGVTQPVSAAALPLPADASTAALQTTGNTALTSIDTKLNGGLGVKDTNGQGAVRYTTDTVAVTGGNFAQIVCLTATTFSLLTRTGATGSLAGVSLPAGTLLIGPFTAYTLSSGAVAAYT